jgi:hypothetical protein
MSKKNCGGCSGGSCGCAPKTLTKPVDLDQYKIGQDVPRLPYDTLYTRCACGRLGLTLDLWREYGTVKGVVGFAITTADGRHWAKDPARPDFDVECPPPSNLPHEIREQLMPLLGDPLPGVDR